MVQAQNSQLRVLLLRLPIEPDDAAGVASHWARLKKSLSVFTDFREIERLELDAAELEQLIEGYDHVFLDCSIAPWDALEARAHPGLTLISASGFEQNALKSAPKCFSRHSCLVLEGIGASDLLRSLHLYLLPKRLAGVTPLMEKGSLILGEKVMDTHNLGALLDRLAAYLEQIEGNELIHRINDLRQVLSALLFEALTCAKNTDTIFPSVDFQAGASGGKLAVNLRFPRGNLSVEKLPGQILQGQSFFWHQAWQCSDLLLLTYHRASNEVEVMLLLCQPERLSASQFRSLLFRNSDFPAQKENLLEPPQNYSFRLISEIRPQTSDYVLVASESFEEIARDIDFSVLPENVAQGIYQLKEHCQALSKQIQKKESVLKDALGGAQAAQRELTFKRGELLQALKASELHTHAAEVKIADLEMKLEQLKRMPKESGSGGKGQENTARLETMLRMAENEKVGMRDAIAHEQKRVASIEQKYSALFRDIAVKDREINDLKTALIKTRKEQAAKKPGWADGAEPSEEVAHQLKQAEQRETFYKQEIFSAKAKQVELLKRISDLVASLKKAGKAA